MPPKQHNINNRPLRKLAEESVLQGDAEHRTGVYMPVHEDSSTASTKQDTSSVEFPKRSNVIHDKIYYVQWLCCYLAIVPAALLFYYGTHIPFIFRFRGDAYQYLNIAHQFHSLWDALSYMGDRAPGLPWFEYLVMQTKSSYALDEIVNKICFILFLVHELSVLFLGWALIKSDILPKTSWRTFLFIILLMCWPTLVMHTTTPITDTLAVDLLLLTYMLLIIAEYITKNHFFIILCSIFSGIFLAYSLLMRPAYGAAAIVFVSIYVGLTVWRVWKQNNHIILLRSFIVLGFIGVLIPILLNGKMHFGTYCIENPDTFPILRHIKDGLIGARLLWFLEPTGLSFFPIVPDPFMVKHFYLNCQLNSIWGLTDTSLVGCLLQNFIYSIVFFIKKWIGFFDAFRMTPYTELITPAWYVWLSRTFSILAFIGLGITLIRGVKYGVHGIILRHHSLNPLFVATWCFFVVLLMTHSTLHVEERFILPCLPLCLFMFIYQFSITYTNTKHRLYYISAWTVFCLILSILFIIQVRDWDARVALYPDHQELTVPIIS